MKILRNILSIIVGCVVGGLVNMGLVMLGPYLIPPPSEADLTTMEGLKAAMEIMEPKHFLFPFLAHALGTLVGALIAGFIAASHKKIFAMVIGLCFLVGGILNIIMLPSPLWFILLDLVVAYIPMGWLGGKLATLKKG